MQETEVNHSNNLGYSRDAYSFFKNSAHPNKLDTEEYWIRWTYLFNSIQQVLIFRFIPGSLLRCRSTHSCLSDTDDNVSFRIELFKRGRRSILHPRDLWLIQLPEILDFDQPVQVLLKLNHDYALVPVVGLYFGLDQCARFCRLLNFVTVRFDRHSLFSVSVVRSCQLTWQCCTGTGSLNAGLESKDDGEITVNRKKSFWFFFLRQISILGLVVAP